jgi:hypothetical protein
MVSAVIGRHYLLNWSIAMKQLVLISLLALHSFAMAQNPTSDLDKLVRVFGEAWLAADGAQLDRLLAREYTHTDVTGRVLDRTEWLTDAENAQKWLRSPHGTSKPSIEFEDMQIRVYGDVAVVTGMNVIHSANLKDKPMRLRFTQVWVKEDGEWKRRFFQGTQVAQN